MWLCLALLVLSDAASPLKDRSFRWLPITDIRPRGWLETQATIQAETLGGHLHEFFVNNSQWIGGDQVFNLGEEVPYWLNGIIPLSVQLDDERLLSVVHRYIKVILDRQRPDGWLGPYNASNDETQTPWSRYRMLTVLGEYADLPDADPRTTHAMHALTHRLHQELLNISEPDLRYKYAWAHARWFEFVGNIQELIDKDPDNMFGDQDDLMKAMQTARDKGLDWRSWYKSRLCENATDTECFPCRETHSKSCKFGYCQYICEHGVNVAQSQLVWGLDYRLGDTDAPDTAQAVLRRLDYCHGQPGAIFSAHEVLDGVAPNRGTETCVVVELMNSYAQLFSIFGEVAYLDRVEAAAFNRLPAPYLNGSMWALQYFHQTSSAGGCNDYGLPFECCVTNGNQGWPKLTAHLYARSPDDGLVAALYAPSVVTTTAGGGKVFIELDTSYPFGEELHFSIVAKKMFPFRLRIPGWAINATLSIDGEAPQHVSNGTLKLIHVEAGKTSLRLVLPMTIRVERATADAEGVVVKAGALLFAMDLDPEVDKTSQCYYPPHGCWSTVQGTRDWRRALLLDPSDPMAGGLQLQERCPLGGVPFSRNSVALQIQARAIRLPAATWPTVNCTGQENCQNCVGPVPAEEAVHKHAMGPPETVTLLPFGATDVRIAVLPATWRTPISEPTFRISV